MGSLTAVVHRGGEGRESFFKRLFLGGYETFDSFKVVRNGT